MSEFAALLTDAAALNELLDEGGRWAGGRIAFARAERIGVGYGLSGMIHRITARLEHGDAASLVAKVEDSSRTRSAVTGWHHAGRLLERSVPTLYGSTIGDERGLILTEDISPGRQGDDLIGCTPEEAADIVDLVARLHVATAMDDDAEPPPHAGEFHVRIRPADHWEVVLGRARQRYPDVVGGAHVDRLGSLPEQIRRDVERIDTTEGRAWIHVDPHLDNVIWRPDGSPVLLDWSNSRLGPPEVDVAALLVGYAFRSTPALAPGALVQRYERTAGREIRIERLRLVLRAVFVQGIVGWAGEESNEGFPDRKEALRDDAICRAIRALDWT